jgi:hypothetical protein
VSVVDFAKLTWSVFDSRVSVRSASPSIQRVVFVLYDAFAFTATVDESDGSWAVVMVLSDREASVQSFLGHSTAQLMGEAQIREALLVIDEYCRLRLPDSYLVAFDDAMLRQKALQT